MESLHVFFNPLTLSVRESTDPQGKPSRTVEGCAIVFNKETVLWDGAYERIREVIAPSCITSSFLKTQDVKLNLLHKRDLTLARCNKGKGSMKMEIREDGLYFTAEMPECDLGDQALALIKNGTYSGCSFEFYPKDYTTDTVTIDPETGKTDSLITHTAFESLGALTIALDPAYPQTTIDIREQARQRENDRNAAQHEAPAAPAPAPCVKPRLTHTRLA